MTYQKLPLKIVIPACLLITLFAGYQLLISPNKQRLVQVKQQTAKSQQQLTKINQQVQALNKNKLSATVIDSKKLAQSISTSQLADKIITAANSRNITIQSFNPEPSIHEKGLSQQPLTVIAQGSYHSLLSFIQGLVQMPIFILIENYELTKPNGQSNLQLQMRLVVYSTGAPKNA